MLRIIKPSTRAQASAVNMLGVPFDGAVLGRKGAAGGPAGIREAMVGFSNFNVELGLSLEDARIYDLGDLAVDNFNVAKTHSQVETEVAEIIRDDSLLIILGGDNSISLPALASCRRKLGKLGLIVVDSHLDLRGEIHGKPTSGSSYGLAIKRGIVDPRKVVEIGVHGFLNSRVYVDKASELGITLFSAEDVSRRGPKVVARESYTLASRGTEAVYLSVDLDAIDLAQVSGVSAPSAGGMWARSALNLVYELARGPQVKCADLVELAPSLDLTGGSQRVAAAAVVYIIAGYYARDNRGRSSRGPG